MLNWFETKAPIRQKFKILLLVIGSLAMVGPLTTIASVMGVGSGPVLVSAATASMVLIVLTLLAATDRVCRPYVNTVVRMEALAAGDTATAIQYTDYTDCVGRMTTAMAAFRDNAVAVENNHRSQELVVSKLGTALKALADNRLDCAITDIFPSEYEALRKDFNSAVASLGSAIASVHQTANSVLTGASEIHTASDDLSRRNEQQAASLEETSAAMNQVTQGVQEAATGARNAQGVISAVHREATEGGAVVQHAVEAMAAIEKSAAEISQIIGVIDGIAFQTNLLALNAGVEAARAGDAGKGFAVVANEVRALAQRSAEAAKDIGTLISASSKQVENGVRLVGETGELLSKLVSDVSGINTQIAGIAETTQSQAAGLSQVNAAIGDLDRVTQQNAAMVEEASAATRSLADEAQVLSKVVNQFALTSNSAPARQSSIQPKPIARTTTPRAETSQPATQGALALKIQPSEEDWSEF